MSASQWTWFDLAGRSMWPLAPPLQVAIGAPPTTVHVGDCVAFLGAHGRWVVHRVVAVDVDHVWTRGDTNLHRDPPWPRHAAIGKVMAVRWRGIMLPVPQEGRLSMVLRHGGMQWARLAPHLRRGWQKLSGTRKRAGNASEC